MFVGYFKVLKFKKLFHLHVVKQHIFQFKFRRYTSVILFYCSIQNKHNTIAIITPFSETTA